MTGHAPPDAELVDVFGQFYYDPEGFVDYVFPWGEKGTPLENEEVDVWQREELRNIGNQFRKIALGIVDEGKLLSNTVRIAISSGHGIGKTAWLAWLIIWFMSTRPTPQMMVTAGTLSQLKTKVWRELSKWHDLSIHKHWFEWTATAFKLKDDPVKTCANAVAWSEHNPQAFAGTHEAHVAYIFDEASTIAHTIWDTSEGAFTTPGPHLWLGCSQNTDPQGRFAECWTKHRDEWQTREIDARKARKTDKNLFAQWARIHGEDSDFFRVRVMGKLPKSGPKQFIPMDLVERAQARYAKFDPKVIPFSIPKIMGVDPAAGGGNLTKIVIRRGDYVEKDILTFDERDLMKLASHIAHLIQTLKPDVVFIDAIGIGKGVFDRLIQLGYANVIACNSGAQEDTIDRRTYYNPRIEWWARGKEWLKTGCIPPDRDLQGDLVAPQFLFDIQMRQLLESKDDMKLRGIPSPDTGDAFMLTFAHPVPVKLTMHQEEDSGVEPEVA